MEPIKARDPNGIQCGEGDTNASPRRHQFVAEHLDAGTRQTIDRDAQYFLHQSMSTPCLNALTSAQGSYLVDSQGRQILDFHGNSVHQLGHAHPEVVEAVKQQLDALAFCPRRYTNEPAIELARMLSKMAPVQQTNSPAQVLLAPAGTLAIGVALKLARFATGRFKTISMWESFHGASLDAISVGGEAEFRQGMGPLLPGCIHVPPYTPNGLGAQSLEYLAYVMEREPEIGAVVAEPVRWTNVVSPPQEYWQGIRELCDRHGALLIIDEVPSCLGRTGRMFCCEHYADMQPDILVIGKGLGGGVFPLAAMIARGDLNVAQDVSLGHYTHEKSPVGCAAASKTIEVIQRDGLVERAKSLGATTIDQLRGRLSQSRIIADVRGLGLHMAVEFKARFEDGKPLGEFADEVLYQCLRRGLSFKTSGGNVAVLCPPLTISKDEMSAAVDILATTIEELEQQLTEK